MIIQHQHIYAEITYSADTKSYYGELLDLDQTICFMASNKQSAILLMQHLAERYYEGASNIRYPAKPNNYPELID